MGVKPGYKQTEVGVIPEDWDIKLLGSITRLLTNGFVGKATDKYVESDDGIIYIQGYNVEKNGLNLNGIKRISVDFHKKNARSILKSGDLLTIQTGDIGITTIVPPELEGANCHALIISRIDENYGIPEFFCQYFNSNYGINYFKGIETGTTMKHLNTGDVRFMALPVPPLPNKPPSPPPSPMWTPSSPPWTG
jgi:type I restriction enzyme S subunit